MLFLSTSSSFGCSQLSHLFSCPTTRVNHRVFRESRAGIFIAVNVLHFAMIDRKKRISSSNGVQQGFTLSVFANVFRPPQCCSYTFFPACLNLSPVSKFMATPLMPAMLCKYLRFVFQPIQKIKSKKSYTHTSI